MALTVATAPTKIEINLIDEPEGIIRMDIDPDGVIDLAASIKEIGLLQAILVRPRDGRYEVVFGHRRFLACQRLGMSRILATVRELDDIQVALMRATENIERIDISPIEEAAVYQHLHEQLGLSIDAIGQKMGKSPSIVRRRLDLLRMPANLQQAIHQGKIGYSVAEALWSLGDTSAIDYYLPFAIEHGATLEVVRGWVRDHKDELRRQEGGPVRGGGFANPMEACPVYVACDLCRGAMEIGHETVIRACPTCTNILSKTQEEV